MAIKFESLDGKIELYFENERLLVVKPKTKLQLNGKEFLPKFTGTKVEDIAGKISFYIEELPENLSHLSAIVLDNVDKSFEITLMTSFIDRDSWARVYSFSEYIYQLEQLVSGCIPPTKAYQKSEYFKHTNLSAIGFTFKLSNGDLLDYVLKCSENILNALDEADRLLVARRTNKETLNKVIINFVEGVHCGLEENQTTEFKEIKGGNPKQSIESPLDKYIISFLNSEGGSIYWGITDAGIVKGIKLTSENRDNINRAISSVLDCIEPPIDPAIVHITYHDVENMEDHYVLEVSVPKSGSDLLYFNKSHNTWIRLNGVSKSLKGLPLQEHIRRRQLIRA
ncbi:ATP-binding protein [Rheinheimera faecalis]